MGLLLLFGKHGAKTRSLRQGRVSRDVSLLSGEELPKMWQSFRPRWLTLDMSQVLMELLLLLMEGVFACSSSTRRRSTRQGKDLT